MEQAKEMIEYAKAHQKKVDENMLKSSFQDCGSKGKYQNILNLPW